jgi:polyferredoxin
MKKLSRPTGLIRYDSQNGLAGKRRRLLRPRILVYALLMLMGAGAFALGITRLKSFEMTVVRMRGMPFFVDHDVVRNQFLFRLVSKADAPVAYKLMIEGAPPGLIAAGLQNEVVVAPQQELQQTLMFTMKATDYQGEFKFQISGRPAGGGDLITKEVEFLGPDPRLFMKDASPADAHTP